MAHAGREIHGQGGFRLRLVRTAAETAGEVLEMEATYGDTAWLPPEHLHPRQAERFEVLDGTVRAIIGGTERRYGPGEKFEVPAGTPHQMTGEGPSRVRWEVRPALRTAEFFERLYGDGAGSARAAASIAELLAEFSDEIRITGTRHGQQVDNRPRSRSEMIPRRRRSTLNPPEEAAWRVGSRQRS